MAKKIKRTPLSFQRLASALAKREGLKHEAAIADIRELLGHLSDIAVLDSQTTAELVALLVKNGLRRKARKK